MGLPAKNRLRKTIEFDRVKQSPMRWIVKGLFSIQLLIENKEEAIQETKIGFVASKKLGNAVARNRAKRIFREIVRGYLDELPKNALLVIVIFPNYKKIPFSNLKELFRNGIYQLINKG